MYGECELCGRVTYLETHHIIPRACRIPNVDLDDPSNLIDICMVCHAKLTPRGLLTKYGQRRPIPTSTKRILDFYTELNECEDRLSATDVLDIFDKHFPVEGRSVIK